MKILIDIGHPAHVHYFKNFIWEMEKKRHEFLITARDRKYVFDLLSAYGFSAINRGRGSSSLFGKIMCIPYGEYVILKHAKKFNPDVFLSFHSFYAAHAAKILGKPHIAFDDTEHAVFEHMLSVPFTDMICTPACFKKDFGEKHRRFKGYMELCYLHPRRFKPISDIYEDINVGKNENYSVVRFVSWDASHDIGQRGLNINEKIGLVEYLTGFGRVFICSDSTIPQELRKYELNIEAHKMHSVLLNSQILVGESATMSSECSVLGVPSLFIDPFGRGYTDEQEEKYGLVKNYRHTCINELKNGIHDIMEKPKSHWKSAQRSLLDENIDVTGWMIDLFENETF
jgi:uncharacterized protein